MPSATRAERSDSRAAKAATAIAGAARSCSIPQVKAGNRGAGRPVGRAPMLCTVIGNNTTATVATMIDISAKGQRGRYFSPMRWRATTPKATASGCQAWLQSACRMVCQPATSVDSEVPRGASRMSGSCWRAMMTPMPIVKPSTTGNGMNSTDLPTAVSAIATTMTPPKMASSGTTSSPYLAITGSRTTVIAPVGPETWRCEPPNTAATISATTAVTRPAAAPAPEATQKPSARGRATTPTVMPAMRSLVHECLSPA